MNLTYRLLRTLAVFAAALYLAGCATTELPTTTVGDAEVVPFQTDTGEAGYHLLLAELAVERAQYAVAASEYRKAALLSDDVEIAERAVRLATQVGRDDDALASARRWIELAPDSLVARRTVAVLLLARNDVNGAVKEIRQLLPLVDDDPHNAFLPLTVVLLDAESPTAIRTMQRLLEDYDDVAGAHYAMGTVALGAQNYELALRHARRAEELRPDWYQAGILTARSLVASGDIDAGLERASEIARISSEPGIRLDYALLLAGLQREGEARLELDLLLGDHPRMAGALRAAGMLELRRGDLDAAQLHFTSLLATGRNIWEAFYYLGSIAEERGQFERAIRYYSQVRDDDLVIPAQVRAAMLFERLGEPERGIEHLLDVARENPQFDAELSIAAGEMLARRGEADRALEAYNQVLIRHPGHRGARFARAFLLDLNGRFDDAVTELRSLLAETPADPIALNALGYTLANRSVKLREAYRLIRKAHNMDPESPAIIDSMGWIEFRRGNPDKALQYLQQAYEQLPDPEVAAHLAEVLYTVGRSDEAKELIERSLVEHPGHEALVDTVQRLGL